MSGQEVRASGYYWVRVSSEFNWEIAWFESEFKEWLLMSGGIWQDNEISEIDENRIMRDAERLAIYLEAKKTDKLNDQESKCS